MTPFLNLWLFPRRQSGRAMQVTTHLQRFPKIRVREAVAYLPSTFEYSVILY
jgi:hypothetical protein